MIFKVGQKVGLQYKPAPLKHREKVRGVITKRDGEYIYVRPFWCKWEVECYASELYHEWDARY